MQRVRSSGPVLALAALTVLLFGAWMHWSVLDPRRVGWLLDGNDRGQNSLGLLAYLRGGAPWPSLHDPLLMAPQGLGVALTDSNPLLALALRPFTGWLLPYGWQYAGWWLLACVALQVAFAWKLLRPFAPDGGTALAGTALLAAAPVLFARSGHINLCAQWLILWALWTYIDADRAARPLRWVAVIAVAWLVHPYLLVMVAAIWAGAQLRALVSAPDRRGRTAIGAVAVAAVLILMPVWLGYLAEPFAITGDYGIYGMALDALWTPGETLNSALLPAAATSAEQGFEGLNYPGAGGLAIIATAIAAAVGLGRMPSVAGPHLRTLWWLLPGLTVLAVVAVGPDLIWRGRVIATLPYPEALRAALDPVRASGRLFWPALYTIMFAATAAVCRMRHGRALLIAALTLQVVDLAPMLTAARALTTRADDVRILRRTPDPRWTALVAGASAVEFYPPRPYVDMAVMQEVAWRAISHCRPVPLAYFYASREARSVHARLAGEARRFARGEVDPTRLHVLLRGPVPPPLAGRARVLDGVVVIPPARPVPRPC